MDKYLIIGKNGQLGKEFTRHLSSKNESIISLGHDELDICDLQAVIEAVDHFKPSIIINASAYNQVDLAETNFVDAYKTNGLAINNLVFAAKKYQSLIINYSTDYVFDGEKNDGLYSEDDKVNPLNEYGKSKYFGESILSEYNNKLLFRTSWVFGEGKQNFIYKFLEWSKNNDTLKISSDEVSVPTSTKTIVDITLKAIKHGMKGKYHLTNSGYCSRYEFAKYVSELKNMNNTIYPVNIDSFNLPARRPKFSAMSNEKISSILNVEIPDWKSVVKDYISAL